MRCRRGLATEGAVRPLDPPVREVWIGVDRLERLVDARHVADAAQRIHGHTHGSSGAPGVEGSFGRCAEKGAGILGGEPPGLRDGEEAT